MNLLFLMTDHQRFDMIDKVVGGVEVTPNLNRLKKDGTFFSDCYNTCPLCVPARSALATGVYPTKSGVVYNDWKGVTAGDYDTMQGLLKKNGFQTAHVSVDHIRMIPRIKDLDLDCYVSNEDWQNYLKENGIEIAKNPKDKVQVLENVEGEVKENSYSGTNVSIFNEDIKFQKDHFFTSKALQFLDSVDKSKNFALFLNLWAPHPPLCVPSEYLEKFSLSDIELPFNVALEEINECSEYEKGVPRQLAKGVSLDEWKNVWRAHYALSNMSDHLIGLVIDKVKSLGLYDDTVIVFTPDHGDHLGQHNMYQKMEMYQEAIHVPLMMRVPGAKSSSLDFVTSHMDVYPTLMDILGIDYDASPLSGESLKDDILLGARNRERYAFSQYSGNPSYGDVRRAIIGERYKLVVDTSGEIALYDRKIDPSEMENIASREWARDIVVDLYGRLKEFHTKNNDRFFID